MKIPTLQQLDNNQPLIQLGLLNLALMIILIKDIGFLFSIFSFALIFVIVSLVYHHVLRHGKAEGQKELSLFDQQLAGKFGHIRTKFTEKLSAMENEQQAKKKNTLLIMLVVVYFCLTFVYDWMQAFIFLNFTYVYFFMPNLFYKLTNFVKSICSSQCPFAARK